MRTMMRAVGAVLPSLAFLVATAQAGQPLETETTSLPHRGEFIAEAGYEWQTSNAGTESAVPLAFEYGLSDRFELLVEPIPLASIRDRGAPAQRGFGDVEATVVSLLASQRSWRPAIALATEVKIPTARKPRVGSGKADYTITVVASRRLGRWSAHANGGYAIIGAPAGTPVDNVYTYAFALERPISGRLEAVGEVYGSTAALAETADVTGAGESQKTPEIGGAERVMSIGARYHASNALVCALGLSRDNNGATVLHPGLTWSW